MYGPHLLGKRKFTNSYLSVSFIFPNRLVIDMKMNIDINSVQNV